MKKILWVTSLVVLLAAVPATAQMMGGDGHMYKEGETQQRSEMRAEGKSRPAVGYGSYQMYPGMGNYDYGGMMGGYGYQMPQNMMMGYGNMMPMTGSPVPPGMMMGGYGFQMPQNMMMGYGNMMPMTGSPVPPGMMMGGYGYNMMPQMYGMGPSMMGTGYQPCMAGYGMTPNMMGYGMGQHGLMQGYPMSPQMGSDGRQSLEKYNEKYNKFLADTKELRRKLHGLKFDYAEAQRSSSTSEEDLKEMNDEIVDLQQQIYKKGLE